MLIFASSLSLILILFFLLSPWWFLVGHTHYGMQQPNRILLVTIHHMLYPITVDVLHQVFSSYGYVEKIVTFQKSAGQLLLASPPIISVECGDFVSIGSVGFLCQNLLPMCCSFLCRFFVVK